MYERQKNTELVNLTVSMLTALVFWFTVCWIVPVTPMIIALLLDLTHASFFVMWLSGLPITGISIIYFARAH